MSKSDSEQHPFQIQQNIGESEEQAIARTMLSPTFQSACTLKEYINSPTELELRALMDCLEKQVDLVKNGVLDSIEQMLLVQAHTLDAIANSLFRRSKCQEYLKQLEAYLKLGLRAQSQCRANLEALINMKNPKTHLNQTNIAHNQQINNAQSKLMEKADGERLDLGATETPISANKELAAVETVHRAKNCSG